jgi:hypothetical protein
MAISPITSKFNADGSPRPCIGNTVICRINEGTEAYNATLKVLNDFKKLKCASKLTFLPPSSFHMTVIGLTILKVFETEEELTKKAMKESDQSMINAVNSVKPFTNVRMKPMRLSFLKRSDIPIRLEPASQEDTEVLRQYRDQIAEATNVRHLNHEYFKFHISLAYIIEHLTSDEISEIELFNQMAHEELCHTFATWSTGPPMLTFFKDMFEFVSEDEIFKVRE